MTFSCHLRFCSGGERSFTTIALLLALGESLETPFRCADEFDVFMDPQVRKTVISTLIWMARQLKHRQFIFLTPQGMCIIGLAQSQYCWCAGFLTLFITLLPDLSSVQPAPDLKIFHLLPPERNNNNNPELTQQTLDMSQQD